jgi:hypothetical protein
MYEWKYNLHMKVNSFITRDYEYSICNWDIFPLILMSDFVSIKELIVSVSRNWLCQYQGTDCVSIKELIVSVSRNWLCQYQGTDCVSIKELIVILKIKGQCDIKHIMMLSIKTIKSVLNVWRTLSIVLQLVLSDSLLY